MPAGDVDVFDQQPQQLLSLGAVELVDDFAAVTPGLLVTPPGGDFAGAAVQLGQVDEPGLVQVGQPASLGRGGADLAVEAAELGGEQLVAGDRGADRDRLLTGQKHA